MKKAILIVLAVFTLVALTGCSDEGSGNGPSNNSADVQTPVLQPVVEQDPAVVDADKYLRDEVFDLLSYVTDSGLKLSNRGANYTYYFVRDDRVFCFDVMKEGCIVTFPDPEDATLVYTYARMESPLEGTPVTLRVTEDEAIDVHESTFRRCLVAVEWLIDGDRNDMALYEEFKPSIVTHMVLEYDLENGRVSTKASEMKVITQDFIQYE